MTTRQSGKMVTVDARDVMWNLPKKEQDRRIKMIKDRYKARKENIRADQLAAKAAKLHGSELERFVHSFAFFATKTQSYQVLFQLAAETNPVRIKK